jgi:hypothetical protein
VGTAFSSFNDVLSGIPQGSILGPTLFTIFINDISDDIQSFCRIFADDTKAFKSYCDIWNLTINVQKTKV